MLCNKLFSSKKVYEQQKRLVYYQHQMCILDLEIQN